MFYLLIMTSNTSDSKLRQLYPDEFFLNLPNDDFKEKNDFEEEINIMFRRMVFSARILFNCYKKHNKQSNIEDFLQANFNEELTYKQQLISIFKSFPHKYKKKFYHNHNNEEIIEKLKSKIYEDSDDKILFFDSN